jgi:hypothetical protein
MGMTEAEHGNEALVDCARGDYGLCPDAVCQAVEDSGRQADELADQLA